MTIKSMTNIPFSGCRIKQAKNQALFVGTTLFLLIIFIAPLIGASFNPARSLGPAMASGYFDNLYVYYIGPITGALIAGIVFRMVRERNGRATAKGNLVRMC